MNQEKKASNIIMLCIIRYKKTALIFYSKANSRPWMLSSFFQFLDKTIILSTIQSKAKKND